MTLLLESLTVAWLFKNLPAICEILRPTEVFKTACHSSHHNLLISTALHTRQLQSTTAPQWIPRNSYILTPRV